MIELTKIDGERNRGVTAYDIEQGKTLSFIFGGNQDYHLMLEVTENGTLDEDDSLSFIIDLSHLELYNCFTELFNATKEITHNLQTGHRNIILPPFTGKITCDNYFDINDLFDQNNNSIVWPSEMGSGLNKDTVMYLKQVADKYIITFKNDELVSVNKRYPRNVCICNSGSRSFIFPYLYWAFFQKLNNISKISVPTNNEAKILRKNNNHPA
ncbi:MAG TPA: hypothetical protein PK737_02040 [Bacilli bacterium]|nr:hypothetical protein [Bacilli bacterium]